MCLQQAIRDLVHNVTLHKLLTQILLKCLLHLSMLGKKKILFHREENSLVQEFVFEVLVVFVESLALAHADEKSLGKR